jgi:streptogramin lyase
MRRPCVLACAVAALAATCATAGGAPPRRARVIHLGHDVITGSVTAYDGSIWAASHEGNDLFRISPADDRIVARIRVGENQCIGGAAGGGAVFEPNCAAETGQGWVYEIDARSNRVVRRIAGIGAAYAAGSLWTTSQDDSALLRVDPRSGIVLARIRLPVQPPRYWDFPTTMCGGSLWVLADTAIVRIDPGTNRAAGVIQLPGARSAYGPGGGYFSANFAACAGGSLWVPNLAGLYRIDPPTGAARRLRIAVHASAGLGDPGVTAGAGSVFVRTSDTTITRVDARTGRIQRTYPAGGRGGEQIAVVGGSLWVPVAYPGDVWRDRLAG